MKKQLKAGALALVALSCAGLLFAQKQTTVTYLTWYTQGEEKILIDAFMKANPDIKVEVEGIDGSKYMELLKPRLAAGDVPDVITTLPAVFDIIKKDAQLLDLSKEPIMVLQNKVPALRDAMTYNGKVYGFVHEAGFNGFVYYNKLLLQKIGAKVPNTVEEYEAVLEKAKKAGIDPIVYGGKDAWVLNMNGQYENESLVTSIVAKKTGGKVLDWNKAFFDGSLKPSDYYKLPMERMKKYWDAGWISKNSRSFTWPESFAYFAAGKALFFPQGPWVPGMDEAKKADPAKLQLGCIYAPQKTQDGKYYLSTGISKLLAIYSGTKNVEAAKKLVNWMGSDAALKLYFEYRGMFSPYPIAYNPPAIFADVVKKIDSLKPVTFITTFPGAPGFDPGPGYQNVLAGGSVADELQKLDAFYAEHKADIKQ